MPRCSAARLDFRIILAGFNARLEFLTGFTELLSLILAGQIMEGVSESMGATAKLWHFRKVAFLPLFLVLACWPLEFLVISGLATRMKGSATIQ
jgi:hypothetical protein